MMQPISGTPARPPGEGQPAVSTAGEQPLSTQQRTVLERLITRLISLTQQQSAEVWAGMKHDLGVKSDTPLLSRHFLRRSKTSASVLTRLNRIMPTVRCFRS